MKCSTPTWSAPSSCSFFSWLPKPSSLPPGRKQLTLSNISNEKVHEDKWISIHSIPISGSKYCHNFKFIIHFHVTTSLFFVCSLYPAILHISAFLLAYMLLLLVALAEEFKWTPLLLQQFCCWIHENNSARNILTLTAIVINFGLVSTDMVRA